MNGGSASADDGGSEPKTPTATAAAAAAGDHLFDSFGSPISAAVHSSGSGRAAATVNAATPLKTYMSRWCRT